jgi:DNA polymerase III delta prime subunit
MALNIHQTIMDKLKYFYTMHKIPNIIFHGQSGCGKRTIVNEFINIIYNNDKERIKSFVMYVNCAHGKGIKFIREELKFFAKTHINSNGGDTFKSIILLNADKLTIDAQSALRRCIELFSHTTRFFIIVEDKYKLLKPILSRFCEIYIPEPNYNGTTINLYRFNLDETFKMKDIKLLRTEWLKKELQKKANNVINVNHEELILFSTKLYEKGYSGLDLIHVLEKPSNLKIPNLTENKRYELLFAFNKIRKEFRNEKIFIMFILNFVFLSLDDSLENISFM